MTNWKFLPISWILLCALVILSSVNLIAQSPQGINYQAVARDGNGNMLDQRMIGVQFGILQGSATGTLVYEEEHSINTGRTVITNDFGLFNLVIGEGGNTGSGTLNNFSDIDWSTGDYYLNVKIDAGNNYENVGTTQLMSVPYALFAASSGDKLTAGDGIEINNNVISNAGDTSNSNELISRFELINDSLLIIDEGNSSDTVSFGELLKADSLAFDRPANDVVSLAIVGGNQITFSIRDDDSDANNELQNLFLNGSGDTLKMTMGGAGIALADLGSEQQISLSNDTIQLSGASSSFVALAPLLGVDSVFKLNDTSLVVQNFEGNKDTLIFNGNLSDTSRTNELIDSAKVNGNSLEIYQFGGAISADITSLINTDNQNLSLVGDSIAISNGTGINLQGILGVDSIKNFNDTTLQIFNADGSTDFVNLKGAGVDTSNTNELVDTMYFSNSHLFYSQQGELDSVGLDSVAKFQRAILRAQIAQNRNNIDSLDKYFTIDSSLTIQNRDSIDVLVGLINAADTDEQNLSISGDTLFIERGDSVNLNVFRDTAAINALTQRVNSDSLKRFLGDNNLQDGLDTLNKYFTIDTALTVQNRDSIDVLVGLINAADTDEQNLSISGDTLFIERGDSVNLNVFRDTAAIAALTQRVNSDSLKRFLGDNNLQDGLDTLNKYFTIDTALTAQNRDSIDVLVGLINAADTDEQNLSISGDTLFIERGDSVNLNVFRDTAAIAALTQRVNSDSLKRFLGDNNLQDGLDTLNKYFTIDTALTAQNRDSIDVLVGLINAADTDEQNLSISGDTLFIERGDSVNLNVFRDTAAINALTQRVNSDSLKRFLGDNNLQDGLDTLNKYFTIDTALTVQNRDSIDVLVNIINNSDRQNLSINGDTLFIERGDSVNLNVFRDTAAINALTQRVNSDSLKRFLGDNNLQDGLDTLNKYFTIDTALTVQNRDSIDVLVGLINAADTDEQNLSISGDTLFIERGDSVNLNVFRDTAAINALTQRVNSDSLKRFLGDNNLQDGLDTLNKYFTIDTALTVQNRDSIDALVNIINNSDRQNLSISGDTLFIERGDSVNLNVFRDTAAINALTQRVNTDSLKRFLGDNNLQDGLDTLNKYFTIDTALTVQNRDSIDALVNIINNSDRQNLSISGDTLFIERGDSVNLNVFRDTAAIAALTQRVNTDSLKRFLGDNNLQDGLDTLNKYFTIDTALTVQNRDSIDALVNIINNSDRQNLSISGDTLFIERGDSVNLNVFRDTAAINALTQRVNTDSLKRFLGDMNLQDGLDTLNKYFTIDTALTAQNRDSIDVLVGLINAADTDEQNLSISGDTLFIERGDSVNLNVFRDTAAINALTQRVNSDSLKRFLGDMNLQDGLDTLNKYFTIDTALTAQNRDSIDVLVGLINAADTDEQNLSISGDTLFIERGDSVNLNVFRDTAAIAALTQRVNSDSLKRFLGDNNLQDGLDTLNKYFTIDTALTVQNRDSIDVLVGLINAADTDEQNLSISGDTLFIERGDSVNLNVFRDTAAIAALTQRVNSDSLKRFLGDNNLQDGLDTLNKYFTIDTALTVQNRDSIDVLVGLVSNNLDSITAVQGNIGDTASTLRGLINNSDRQSLAVTADSITIENGMGAYIGDIRDTLTDHNTRINNNLSAIGAEANARQLADAGLSTRIINDSTLTKQNTDSIDVLVGLVSNNLDSITAVQGNIGDTASTLRGLINNSDRQNLAVTADSITIENGMGAYIGDIRDTLTDHNTRINNNLSAIGAEANARQLADAGLSTRIINDSTLTKQNTDSIDVLVGLVSNNLDSITAVQGNIGDTASTLRGLINNSDRQNLAVTADSITIENGMGAYIGDIRDTLTDHNTRINNNLSAIGAEANARQLADAGLSTRIINDSTLTKQNTDSIDVLVGLVSNNLDSITAVQGNIGDTATTLRALINATTDDDNWADNGSTPNMVETNFNTSIGSGNVFTNFIQNSLSAGSSINNQGTNSSGLGNNLNILGDLSTNFGFRNSSSGARAHTMGSWITSTGDDAITIGGGENAGALLSNTLDSTIMFGYRSNLPTMVIRPAEGAGTIGEVGIGTSNPDSLLTVSGGIHAEYIRLSGGTPTIGDVLTTDASGNATWQPNQGDNLGKHELDSNLKINGFYLSNDGDNEGIRIDNDGLVGIGAVPNSNSSLFVPSLKDKSIYSQNSGSSSNKVAVFGEVTGGGTTAYALEGEATSTATQNYGVHAIATGAGGTNYGVFGKAINGGSNYAGYFDEGRVYVRDSLGLNTLNPRSILDVNGKAIINELSINNVYSFPTGDGMPDQILKTDGFGVLSFVNASSVFTNTDNQNLSIVGDSIKIENATGAYIGDIRDSLANNSSRIIADSTALVTHIAADGDLSASNEIQNLSVTSDSIQIAGATGAYIGDIRDSLANNSARISADSAQMRTNLTDTAAVLRGLIPAASTDNQDLSVSSDSIQIVGGTGAYIGDIRDSLANNSSRIIADSTALVTHIAADGDLSASNEIQNLSVTSDSIQIAGATGAYIGDIRDSLANNSARISTDSAQMRTNLTDTAAVLRGLIPAASTDNQDLSVTSDSIQIVGGTGAYIGDIRDSLANNSSRISADSTLLITHLMNDGDLSASNEIQDLSVTSDSIQIAGASGAYIGDIRDSLANNSARISADSAQMRTNLTDTAAVLRGLIPAASTDNQNLSVSSDSIQIVGGTGAYIGDIRDSLANNSARISLDSTLLVTHLMNDGDLSASNEIQDLSVTSDSIQIAGASGAYIGDIRDSLANNSARISADSAQMRTNLTDTAAVLRGLIPAASTDNQNLSVSSDSIQIVGGTGAYIGDIRDSLANNSARISLDSTLLITHLMNDGDLSASNEIQDLSVTSDSIQIAGATGAYIGDIRDSLANNSARISADSTRLVDTAAAIRADFPSFTANSLDAAYDQGGAGNGRTILATDSAVKIAGEDGFIVTGTFGSGDDVEVSGAGTRMFFNPKKAAFRAGRVTGTEWDPANIGDQSMAFGVNTKASGGTSVAFGGTTTASGTVSTAFGNGTTASNTAATSFGSGTVASGTSSTSFGLNTTASGNNSLSSGVNSTSSGIASFAGGSGSNSIGFASLAFGENDTARGINSIAIGDNAIANGPNSIAIGTTVDASGSFSNAFGQNTEASGLNATSFGLLTNASGFYSTVFGFNTNSLSYNETTFGSYNTSYTPNSTNSFNPVDRLFGIGNGTSNALRSDALIIYKSGDAILNGQLTLSTGPGGDSLTFPNTDGSANQILKTDGNGVLSFTNISSLLTADTLDIIADADRNSGVYVNGGDDIIFRTNGSDRLTFDQDGHLGMTTSVSSTGTLDTTYEVARFNALLSGDFKDRTGGHLSFTGSDGGSNFEFARLSWMTNDGESEGMLGFETGVLGDLNLAMIIDENRRVGIGTTDPDSALTVVGGINAEYIRLSGGTPTIGDVLTTDATGKATWQTPNPGSDNQTLSVNLASDSIFITNGNGINIGGLRDSSLTDLSDTALSIRNSINNKLDTAWNYQAYNNLLLNDNFISNDGANEGLQISDAGQGLLTHGLFVNSSSNETNYPLIVKGNSSNLLMAFQNNSGSGIWDIETQGDNLHFNETGVATQLSLYKGGAVSIGTTSQSARLNIASSAGSNAHLINTASGVSTIQSFIVETNGTTNGNNFGIVSTTKNGTSYNSGVYAEATGSGTSSYGIDASAVDSSNGMAYGGRFSAKSEDALSYGIQSTATSVNGTSTAYGLNTEALGSGSINYGLYSKASGASTNYAGYFDDGDVFIKDTLILNKPFKLTVSPGANKLLISDANGVASWGNASALGDDLGDHTATQALDLGTNHLVGDGGSTGIRINNNGKVALGGGPAQSNRRLYVTSTADQWAGQFINSIAGQTNTSFGVDGTSNGSNPGGSNIGVKGEASGAGTNVAVQGIGAGGGSGSYSGYFINGKFYISDSTGMGTANPTARLDVNGKATIDTLDINSKYTFPSEDGNAGEVLKTDGAGALTWQELDTAVCPVGMSNIAGRICIENAERSAASWFTAASDCVADGYKLPSWGEWYGAMDNAPAAVLNKTNNWEWVDGGTSNTARKAGNTTLTATANDNPASGTEAFRCILILK